MSNKKGIDSKARTARLHSFEPHRVPYIKEHKMCDCGGVTQPPSSAEVSAVKRRLKRYGYPGDIIELTRTLKLGLYTEVKEDIKRLHKELDKVARRS